MWYKVFATQKLFLAESFARDELLQKQQEEK